MRFEFAELPLEIQYTILEMCDFRTICSLMAVCQGMNTLTENMMAYKVRQLLGPSYHEEDSDSPSSNRGILIRIFPPDNELLNNRNYWLDTSYLNTDTRNEFSIPYSYFVVGSFQNTNLLQGYETFIEMSQDDEFVQIILQVSIALSNCENLPLQVIRKVQRIYKDWTPGENRLIKNKELTYSIRVENVGNQPRQNEFGEIVYPFKVIISQISFNTAYLLDRLDSVKNSSTIFHGTGGRFTHQITPA